MDILFQHDADPIRENPERGELRRSIRGLIVKESPAERVRELDKALQFDENLYQKLAQLGVLGIDAPVSFGGVGDVRDQLVVIEELAVGPTSMAAFMIAQFAVVQILSKYGHTKAHSDLLRALIKGESKVSFALSEADGGTDVARALKTKAESTDTGFVINGQKLWTSGAHMADYVIILARTTPIEKSPVKGISMFLVPTSAKGFDVRELDTFGIHSLSTCELFFDMVEITEDALLGEVDKGMYQVFSAINREGLNAAAATLGIARAALDYALGYVKQRRVFDKPIGAFQVPQHWLVDAAVSIESARSLMVRAAAVQVAGGNADTLTNMAKLVASEAAVEISHKGMQMMGGAGFLNELPMQRFFRDSRLWSFSPLTNEMVRNRIGEQMLKLPRSY